MTPETILFAGISLITAMIGLWLFDQLWAAKRELRDSQHEERRLQGHVDNARELFAQIVAQETPSANATVSRIVALAKAGCAK